MNKQMEKRRDELADRERRMFKTLRVTWNYQSFKSGTTVWHEEIVKPLVEALAFYCEIDTYIKGIGRVDECARETLKRLGFDE